MADLARSIAIIFEGDDQLSGAISTISGKMSSFETAVQGAAQPLANFADGIIKADMALAAMAVGGIAYAIKASGDFSTQFNEIQTVADGTAEGISALKESIKSYATDSTQSFESLNGAVYSAISAGIDYKESVDFVAEAEKLAVAGKADLNDATVLLASTLNAYGAEASSAADYSDVLFQTVKLGQTTIPELGEALAQVTGVASAAGVPIETLSAAIANLTAAGAPTSQAITGIKAAISNIIKPSGIAAEAAAQLGIEFNAAALESKGLEGVLTDVSNATGGNVETMGKLFGSMEGLNAALVLGTNGGDDFEKTLKAMEEATGATSRAFELMAQNIDLVNQNLANNFQSVFIELGEGLQGSYVDVAGGFADVLGSLSGSISDGAFDEIFAAIETFGDDMLELLSGIAAALPEALEQVDFSELLEAFGDLGVEIGKFFGGLDFTNADDLAVAVQGIVDAVTRIVEVTAGMAEGFQPYFDVLKDAVSETNNFDSESAKSFGNVLASAKMVVDAGVAIAGAVLLMKESGTSLAEAYNFVAGTIEALFNSAQIIMDTIALKIVESINKIVGTAATAFSGLAGALGFDDAAEEARLFAKGLDDLETSIKNTRMENIAQAAEGVALAMGNAKDGTTEVIEKFKELPEDKKIAVDFDFEDADVLEEEVDNIFGQLPHTKEIMLMAVADEEATKAAGEWIVDYTTEILPSGEKKITYIGEADKASFAAAKSDVEEILSGEQKVMKIQAEIEQSVMAKLLADAATIQTAIEWKAKMDIAELEANATKVAALAATISSNFAAAGDVITNSFGVLSNLKDTGDTLLKWQLEDAIKQELQMQQDQVDMQKKLTDAEIEYMKAKTDSLQSGDALIKVQADGLEPALEMIFFEVLEKCQVRMNEEMSEFLLGL